MKHSDSEPKQTFSNYSKDLRSITLIQVWAMGVRNEKVPQEFMVQFSFHHKTEHLK